MGGAPGGAHQGRPRPLGRRPCPSLPPIYSGVWGGRGTQPKAHPPSHIQPFSSSRVVTLALSCDSHVRSCTYRWCRDETHAVVLPVCRAKEIFFRNLGWIEDGRRHRCRTCTSTRGRRTFGRWVSFVELRDLEVGAAVQLHRPRSNR